MNESYIENIIKFPYKLDDFQINAIKAIINNENVLCCSHTGAGKSTIGEFAIANSLKKGKKAIYTTPIKALSNQKFGDFQKKFNYTSVGILTGDIKVNPDANVVVATQEIICNMLHTDIEKFEDVDSLIIDETHYIRDQDRGTVYEQTLAMLPSNIILVMLSATLPNPENLTNWVQKIKNKKCDIFSTNVRPVPLVHEVYWNENFTKIFESNKNNFNEQNYKSIYNIWKEDSNLPVKKQLSNNTHLKNFLNCLNERNLFPALFFNFSRKGCEKLAKMIERSFLDGKEQTESIKFFDYSVKKYLGESGMQLEQVWFLRQLIQKGVAIHHSGLIPILKEIVEHIFDKGFIKIMFVTETFSVGINMPTKSVIFSELQKFDGNTQRLLNNAEYIQMSGRAGRRGLDSLGNVIYFPLPNKKMLTLGEIAQIIKGKNSNITSKFVIDPILMLRCIDKDYSLNNIINSTLMYQEISSELIGIEKEIELIQKQQKNINISETDLTLFNEIEKLEKKHSLLKPKQKKKNQIILNELRKKIDTNSLKNIELYNSHKIDITKLLKNKIDTQEYINNTCNIQKEILKKYGYIDINSDLNYIVTLKGKACSHINETDSFLTIEYFIDLFNRYPEVDITDDNFSSILSFIVGTFVDEKELNKEEYNTDTNLNDIINDISLINSINSEVKILKTLYEKLYSENRLRDFSFKLTPEFGLYVYLWINQNIDYNTIKNSVNTILYEGNFVKSMLKVYNIFEEIMTIADMYQRADIYTILTNLQKKIMKSIVISDSLYIQSS